MEDYRLREAARNEVGALPRGSQWGALILLLAFLLTACGTLQTAGFLFERGELSSRVGTSSSKASMKGKAMLFKRLLWSLAAVWLLSACARLPLAVPERTTPTPTASHHPGVADLLRNPPAPGTVIEVDAYFSGAGAPVFSRPAAPGDQVMCPELYNAALTDRPFLSALKVLNGVRSNLLPNDAPWLIAATPEATQPGRFAEPQLPYHARFRGYLGDPAFAHCSHAERIFVVQAVVTVYREQPPAPWSYEMKLPENYAAWPRYRDAELGYSVPYPPDWTVKLLSEPAALSAIALRAPQWPDHPVMVRVHAGETRYDPYDRSSIPPLLQGEGWGVFEQGWSFGEGTVETQKLAGFRVDRRANPGEGAVAVVFSGHGRTYELALRYPLGFAASQRLLTDYTAMVEGFRLDQPPGPTPTPPVKQALGPGPFLSRDEALSRARERVGDELELLDAQLMSEAEARRLGQPSPCSTFMGHPDGVWVLTVHGALGGISDTYRLFLDATTGEQLCGEEIHPDATPYPTMPRGTTATPAAELEPDSTAVATVARTQTPTPVRTQMEIREKRRATGGWTR